MVATALDEKRGSVPLLMAEMACPNGVDIMPILQYDCGEVPPSAIVRATCPKWVAGG